LMTNPRYGDDDPVYAVGWAQSDYWARRAWEVPFGGELTSPSPQWSSSPSLQFLGRPARLSFGSVCGFERAQRGTETALFGCARYRVTDGAFMTFEIRGIDAVVYFFGSNEPETEDEPVALEFRLQEER
jgi:hypothetical protein